MRTADMASYALNRRPENRRIYAEQQVAWAYAEVLKEQNRYWNGRMQSSVPWADRLRFCERDLAEAHASLDALQAALYG